MSDSENKNSYQKEIFKNRLAKKYRLLKKQMRKERITCYRLYDRDIPEIPLAVDLYEFLPEYITQKDEAGKFMREEDGQISANNAAVISEAKNRTFLHIFLYERPYEKDEAEENEWLKTMAQAASEVIQIPENNVLTKIRKKQKGSEQYEKITSKKTVSGIVQEKGQLFKVNLTNYIDTGLFLDHRPLREEIRRTVRAKSVLNLFCYTGSFSVYAAEGKASRVESVDLSNTYIAWAKENMELNEFSDSTKYFYTKKDAISFLNQKNVEKGSKEDKFDVIILDPPTFSNSKSAANMLDINRDWQNLVLKCINILNPSGILYFSTNSRRLSFSETEITQMSEKPLKIEDITAFSIPEDYKNSKIHRCWKITRLD